jgi:tetratricopeptide (TPR) repeat protein
LFLLPLFCLSQTQTPPELEKIKSLFDEQKWRDVASLAAQNPGRNPELYFYAGMALAQLGEFEQARSQLLLGRNALPRDPRFPTELAGVEFKEKRYAAAAAWLRRAARLNPGDEYVNNFLATNYFVGGNVEAALKYWNRVNRPQVASVEIPKDLHTNPVVIDRALTFSPAAQLRRPDFLTSESRLEGLDVFARQRLRLASADNGTFDVSLDAQERNGFGANKWQAILSTFRGVFYQTAYPEYFNFRGSALNLTSLFRWDSEKRRVSASISGPVRGNPKRRFNLNLDLRNENWDIRPSFTGPAPLLGSLNLRKIAAGASLTSFSSGRLTWSTGVEVSYRDYRNVFAGSTLTPNLLLEGTQIKAAANLRYDLLRIPERRWTTTFLGGSQVSRIWSDPTALFGKFDAAIDNSWLPRFEGDDYEFRERLSASTITGSFPFDELYSLGLERDNDLWLRAHIGTRDGRKGSAPLGRTYFLSSAEINKNLYSNGLLSLRLAPFLDSGKITGPAGLGSNKWLWDTGAQVKLRVLSVGFTFIYGKDLRTGNNAFYLTATR